MSEPTLEQMPLLEYTLKRYAYGLAKRLGVATDIVDEKWDVWVDKRLTYHENKERVKRELMRLGKKEFTKEFEAELKRQEGEEIHRQLTNLLETLKSILYGETDRIEFKIAEETGLLEEPISKWVEEIDRWKYVTIRESLTRELSTILEPLLSIQLKLAKYKTTHGDVPISELVGKMDILSEEIVKTDVEVEEEEVQLRPIIVPKRRKLKPLEIEEEKPRVEKKIEEMTESEVMELIDDLYKRIKSYTKLPLRQRYAKLKELKPQIKQLLKFETFEVKALAHYYKQAVYPLAVYFKEEDEFRFLAYVEPVIR